SRTACSGVSLGSVSGHPNGMGSLPGSGTTKTVPPSPATAASAAGRASAPAGASATTTGASAWGMVSAAAGVMGASAGWRPSRSRRTQRKEPGVSDESARLPGLQGQYQRPSGIYELPTRGSGASSSVVAALALDVREGEEVLGVGLERQAP